ncbi:MAG: 6-bladed beta-propeller [Prevotellaceae bacterium]|jgi:hypothetical protein|nr:6-bladed beta-propeller [Prevotellaceae bacterium]
MKTIKKLSLILILANSNYSCHSPKISDPNLSTALEINCRFEYDSENIISYIDHIEFIPLQTNDESLIGNIKHVYYRNNKYYIHDGQQDKVLIFDSTGKYVSSIDKKGNGPCEYTNIESIYVDDSETVKILPQSHPQKIMKYRYNNHNCEEVDIKSDMTGDKFVPFNNGYLFYQANGAVNPDDRYFLFSTDGNGNVQNKWLSSHSYIPYEMEREVFKVFNDTILFCMPLDNNLYQISSKGDISVRYVFNFGKYSMPESVKKTYREGDLQTFRQQSDGYVRELDIWSETKQALLLSYTNTNMGSPFFALYTKNKRELKVFNPDDLIKIAILSPLAAVNDTFLISCLDISNFRFDEYPQYKEHIGEHYPDLIPVIDTLPEYANPVLVKYKFK